MHPELRARVVADSSQNSYSISSDSMGWPHPSHRSPLPGPPHTLGDRVRGNRCCATRRAISPRFGSLAIASPPQCSTRFVYYFAPKLAQRSVEQRASAVHWKSFTSTALVRGRVQEGWTEEEDAALASTDTAYAKLQSEIDTLMAAPTPPQATIPHGAQRPAACCSWQGSKRNRSES